jgi:hypothetical protein
VQPARRERATQRKTRSKNSWLAGATTALKLASQRLHLREGRDHAALQTRVIPEKNPIEGQVVPNRELDRGVQRTPSPASLELAIRWRSQSGMFGELAATEAQRASNERKALTDSARIRSNRKRRLQSGLRHSALLIEQTRWGKAHCEFKIINCGH